MLTYLSSVTADSLHLNIPGWHWVLLIAWFAVLILGDLALHRKDHETSLRSAGIQSLIWIALGVGLGFLFWPLYGASASAQYFSGYLIEKSLSIDNVFAWSVILAYFRIPKKYQHRVLFWGIFGALVMRAIFIFTGIAVIERFEPVLLFFGLLLIYSGYKLLAHSDEHEFDPSSSKMMKFFTRVIPYSHGLDGHNLFTRKNGKLMATTLFMALLAVELTDVIFAIDSVPAILAVSQDPFIVFSSNAAAILGLRALYFVFDKIKEKFWLLNKGLGILLVGVGIKMFIRPHEILGMPWFGIEVPTNLSLAIIAVFLAAVITLSVKLEPPKKKSA